MQQLQTAKQKTMKRLTDSYIAQLFKMPVDQLRENYPNDLIEAKKMIIKIKRFIVNFEKYEVEETDHENASIQSKRKQHINPRITSISKLKSSLCSLYYDLLNLRICNETALVLIQTANAIINTCVLEQQYNLTIGNNKKINFLQVA